MGASFQSSAAITKTPEERLRGLENRLAWLREAQAEVQDEIISLEKQILDQQRSDVTVEVQPLAVEGEVQS